MRKNVVVLGGDTRQSVLAEYLTKKSYDVQSYGIVSPCAGECLQDALQGADLVVLPLPITTDGKHLYQPLVQGQDLLHLDEIFERIPKTAVVFGGKCSDAIQNRASSYGLQVTDYYENEAFQQKNALLTAEGALSILMREIPRTVKGLPVVVIGYGRIAKALCRILVAMRAEVTVVARRQEAVLAASALGASAVLFRDREALRAALSGKLAVINTAPARLIEEGDLANMRRDALVLDLASAPGGVDGIAAGTLGIRVIWALSLPGKYAPLCAGEIVGETLLEMLEEVEG